MRSNPRPPSRPSRLATVALAGALALGLAACSGAGDTSGAASGAAADGPVSSEVQQGAPGTAGGDAKGGDDAARNAASTGTGAAVDTVVAAVADRKLSRRADVSLRVDDVVKAAARLRQVAAAAGGLVVAEQVSTDTDGPDPVPEGAGGASERVAAWGTVTISVPTAKLDTTLDAVAEIGTVLSRQTSTDDVTGTYVDTASRVASMKASVERVRALMTKAEDLSDVVALESELSRRQADLEALEQQLASLDDQVALAPISVRLTTDGAPVPTEDPTGFRAGLASGWEAFTTSVRLVLTLVGALVPFAIAALVVLGPLAWWWRRRPRPVRTTPPDATSAA